MLGEERIALVITLPEDIKEGLGHLKVRLAAVVATSLPDNNPFRSTLEDRLVELDRCQHEFGQLWLSEEGRKQLWQALATADQALHNYQQWEW